VAEFLTCGGYSVLAMDLRGHGRSGGKRGHMASFTQVIDDYHKLVEKASEEEIICYVDSLLKKTGGYGKFILGTGVIPYSTPSANILCIREHLEAIGV
jgi:alpha-beta hydrolase superfamily lysophospholipase